MFLFWKFSLLMRAFILLAFFTTSPSEIIEKVQGKFEAIQVMLAFAGVPFWIKRKLFEDDEVHHDFRCVVVVVVQRTM